MTIDSAPCVLVGMLHVGEPSVPRVRELIVSQMDVDVELLEIAHLPEREAHERLYRTFDAADPKFDAVVKVDADMELVEPRLLHAIGMLFRRHPSLDYLLIGVDDWFSGQRIHGMTAWRQGIRWTSPPPELFTDLPTNTARTELKLVDVGRALVLHAADPTDEQAVRYGLHRGLKATATAKASRIARLSDIVEHAAVDPERGRLVAVAAIAAALEDRRAATMLLDDLRTDPSAVSQFVERADDPDLLARTSELLATFAAASERLNDASSGAPASASSTIPSMWRQLSALPERLRARAQRRIEHSDVETGGLRDQTLREEFLDLLSPAGRARSGRGARAR